MAIVEEKEEIKNTLTYKQCILSQIDSWRRRENKEEFLKSLELYDEIKLSTFSENAEILNECTFLVVSCLAMGLNKEGFNRRNRAISISLTAQEQKIIFRKKICEFKSEGGNDKGLDEALRKLYGELSHRLEEKQK